MKLVVSVGSYERILYGLDVDLNIKETRAECKESFAIPAHTGCIKSVASCPRFLVSGASDENVRIFDLKKRKDVGSLSQHQGTIDALSFSGSSHLISSGEDGRIALYRTKDWECLHVLKHKKAVHGLAVHPSGKMALSVGKEKSLKLWNLMTGKQAHSSTVPHEPLQILFSEAGKHYVVLSDYNVVLYETGSAKVLFDYKSKTRLNCMAILQERLIYVAGEGTSIQIIDIEKSLDGQVAVREFDSRQPPRIKGMAIVSTAKACILVTGSSSGSIKGWRIPDNEELFAHNAGIRITCLTATVPQ